MKLIQAIVRPEKVNDVLAALFQQDITGLTVTRVQGHGGESEQVETYRGTTVKKELADKVLVTIALSDHYEEKAIKTLMRSARTGEVGDGKIFVMPVEKVYRIRTGEKDAVALTPIVPAEAE